MSIEETQRIFNGLIEKPHLTTQLLSRPPFKFIVDIVSNIIIATGYLKNDFTEEELKEAGSTKEKKLEFLEKLIGLVNDGSLEVKASRVISGKDAEDTNKMLQKLGSNASAFTTKKEKPEKSEKTKKSKSSSKDGSKTSKTKQKKDATEETVKPEKSKSKSSKSSKKDQENPDDKTSDQHKKEKKSSKSSKKRSGSLKRADSTMAVNGDSPTNNSDFPNGEHFDQKKIISDEANNIRTNVTSENVSTPDSNISQNNPTDNLQPMEHQPGIVPNIRPGTTSGRPMTSMGRPGTAVSRPAPPKLKKKQIATIEASELPIVEMKSEIMNEKTAENSKNVEDDFIIENEDDGFVAEAPETVINDEQGTLVKKIIEKKSEIEDGADVDHSEETENKQMFAEKEKARQLQEKLQELTKSAYPLARMFDFANDDIESMIKELERWRSEQRHKELDEQNKKVSGFVDNNRLYNIITNLQKEISFAKEELNKARGRVLSNEKRIQAHALNV